MAKAKRKTLPKDFEALLKAGDLDVLKAVFDTCDLNAYGGYSKQVALAFNDCPDALSRWLVEQGANLEAGDSYDETPLHNRSGHWQGNIAILIDLGAEVNAVDSRGNHPLHKAAGVGNVASVRVLLDHGADADARNKNGQTPLDYALARASNVNIEGLAKIALPLLDAMHSEPPAPSGLLGKAFGKKAAPVPPITPDMKAVVERIGTNFEFGRANFNPDSVDKVSTALDQLYAIFDVPPVPSRMLHDGSAPITVGAGTWQDQHQHLWELLVPGQGPAKTVQGEVIRLSGRINDEIRRNGAVNWDADYKKMGAALATHLASGKPLASDALVAIAELIKTARQRDDTADLCRYAVEWVALNPDPTPLPTPDYNR